MGCKYIKPEGLANILYWINRYIVGCKLVWFSFVCIMQYGINRYIVGCKLAVDGEPLQSTRELIDT